MLPGTLNRKSSKLLSLLGKRSYRRALGRGVAAAIEHEDALDGLNAEIVVDIGANKGQFALVAHELWPSARIIAFEPIPDAAARFRRTLGNGPAVTLHEKAVGVASSRATLHLSKRQDSSSLLPIGELQQTVFPGTGENGTIEVDVCRLDDVLEPAEIHGTALLKLDVQGFELQALRGCETLLDRFSYVYVECSYIELYEGQALAPEVIAYLRDHGFGEPRQYNLVLAESGDAVQADLLFEREKNR